MVAVWTVICLCFVDNDNLLVQVQHKQTMVQTLKAHMTVAMQACRKLSQSSWYDMPSQKHASLFSWLQERFVACCQSVS